MERLFSPYRSFRQTWFIHCPEFLPDIIDYFFSLYTQTFPTERAVWVLAQKEKSSRSHENAAAHPLDELFKNQKLTPPPEFSKWIICACTHKTDFKSHFFPQLSYFFPESAPFCMIYAHPLCIDDDYTFWICFWRHTSHPLYPKTYSRLSRIFELLKHAISQKILDDVMAFNKTLTNHDLDLATLLHQIKAPIQNAESFFSQRESIEEVALAKYFGEAKSFLSQLLQYLRAKHLPLQHHSLIHFIEDLSSGFTTDLNKLGITLNIHSVPNVTINIHRVALYQVFENLIHNIQAKKEVIHQVVLNFRINHPKKLHHNICLELSDDGPGLPSEIALGFGKAFQSSPSSSGMGLYICKRLIELQNGTITYTSPTHQKHGHFSITLPITKE